MKKMTVLLFLTLGECLTANAEMWKWVDDDGSVHYSDKPQHASATGMTLAWSSGPDRNSSSGSHAEPNSSQAAGQDASADAQEERQRVKAKYCNKAKEVYRSYKEAPRLYETGKDGQRRYLSEKEARKVLAETKAKVAELCD